MDKDQVKEHFRRQVNDYEGFMRRIVPEYDRQTQLLMDMIPFDSSATIRVLDLGSGPGTLSERVLQSYPKASVLAFDLTEEMLESARKRCSPFKDRFTTLAGDYKTDNFGTGYDLILAGFTLHHLEDSERQSTFRLIFSALNRGGVFLAREVVADDDSFVAEGNYRLWRQFMTQNGEDGESWYQKHRVKDHPASIEKQIQWLKDAGFAHVACHWKYMNFAILSAHE